MIDLERARNLALLGRKDDALDALDASDHNGLRALELVETAHEFDSFRGSSRFERVHRNMRARVFPCEGEPKARDFDFWIGRWEVREPDGTLVGTNTIEKRDGGCSIEEHCEGAGGSSGTSLSFFLPSRGEWRQVWTGSGGTLFDLTGKARRRLDADGRPGRVRRRQPRGRVPRHVDAGRRRPRAPAARGVRPRRADLDRLVRRLLPPARRAAEVAASAGYGERGDRRALEVRGAVESRR